MKVLRIFAYLLFLLTAYTLPAYSQLQQEQSTDSLQVSFLKVKGITCSSDLKRISANVEMIKGVTSCKAIKQGPKSVFEVRFHPQIANESMITAAIQSTPDCENPEKRPYQVLK